MDRSAQKDAILKLRNSYSVSAIRYFEPTGQENPTTPKRKNVDSLKNALDSL